MSSKGTPIYRFRIPHDVMNAAIATIHRRNNNTAEEPYDLSEFVRQAIVEKIAHMDRSAGRPQFRRAAAKKPGVSYTPDEIVSDVEQ
jgi:hypothetical protein